jgi:CheY-like chemotaxis protein
MPPSTLPSDSTRPTRVLFVDDDLAECEVARIQLGAAGFTVLTAASTVEALAVFDAHEVDVVVTDIYMPGEDGIALIQDLRRRRPWLPIVAITGGGIHQDTSPLRVAAALGAGALLLKPFQVDELVGAIQRLLVVGEAGR